ncbi:MAG TPA: hypothetical protein VF472_05760 [Burkholderiaceae bacterium]
MKRPVKFCLAALSCLGLHARALPVMQVQAEVLLAQSADLRQTLHLNPNQQTLWRKVEANMRNVLDERRHRRERLQDALKQGLTKPDTELRDLAKLYDEEDKASLREDRQLRELFLTVNDALDDGQRQAVLAALNDQLQRMPERGCEPPRNGNRDEQLYGHGMGRHPGSAPQQQAPQQ